MAGGGVIVNEKGRRRGRGGGARGCGSLPPGSHLHSFFYMHNDCGNLFIKVRSTYSGVNKRSYDESE